MHKFTSQFFGAVCLFVLAFILFLPAAARAATCNASQLSVKVDPKFSDAAMGGQRGDGFIVTNISKRTCTVIGSPGVVLLDKHGKTIGSVFKAMAGTDVKLKPGAKATFELGYHSCAFVASVSDRDPKKCKLSAKVEIRLADIKGVWVLKYETDADGGIEHVFDLELKKKS